MNEQLHLLAVIEASNKYGHEDGQAKASVTRFDLEMTKWSLFRLISEHTTFLFPDLHSGIQWSYNG